MKKITLTHEEIIDLIRDAIADRYPELSQDKHGDVHLTVDEDDVTAEIAFVSYN